MEVIYLPRLSVEEIDGCERRAHGKCGGRLFTGFKGELAYAKYKESEGTKGVIAECIAQQSRPFARTGPDLLNVDVKSPNCKSLEQAKNYHLQASSQALSEAGAPVFVYAPFIVALGHHVFMGWATKEELLKAEFVAFREGKTGRQIHASELRSPSTLYPKNVIPCISVDQSVNTMLPNDIIYQTKIPVIYRPKTGDVAVKLPYSSDNRKWLSVGRRSLPKWNAEERYWSLPRSSFQEVVRRILDKYYQGVYVAQHFNCEEKCAPACWNAEGIECECSCMGRHHSMGRPNGTWYVISETRAVRLPNDNLRVSLLKADHDKRICQLSQS